MPEETRKSHPAPGSPGTVEAPAAAGAGPYEYVILTDHCMGCGACARACPQQAIVGEHKRPHAIDQAKCVQCGACYAACRLSAILRM
jgi:NADP-reducing hydrogenase subunit HndC